MSTLVTLPADLIVYICGFLLHAAPSDQKHPILALYGTCRKLRQIILSRAYLLRNPWVCQSQLVNGTPEYARWYIKRYMDVLCRLQFHKFIGARVREVEANMTSEQLMRLYITSQCVLPSSEGCITSHPTVPALRLRKTSEARARSVYSSFYETISGPDSIPSDVYLAIKECQGRFLVLIERIQAHSLSPWPPTDGNSRLPRTL